MCLFLCVRVAFCLFVGFSILVFMFVCRCVNASFRRVHWLRFRDCQCILVCATRSSLPLCWKSQAGVGVEHLLQAPMHHLATLHGEPPGANHCSSSSTAASSGSPGGIAPKRRRDERRTTRCCCWATGSASTIVMNDSEWFMNEKILTDSQTSHS